MLRPYPAPNTRFLNPAMSDLLLPLSESEEMYLVNLARLKEAGEAAPVPLSHLAERMQV